MEIIFIGAGILSLIIMGHFNIKENKALKKENEYLYGCLKLCNQVIEDHQRSIHQHPDHINAPDTNLTRH